MEKFTLPVMAVVITTARSSVFQHYNRCQWRWLTNLMVENSIWRQYLVSNSEFLTVNLFWEIGVDNQIVQFLIIQVSLKIFVQMHIGQFSKI